MVFFILNVCMLALVFEQQRAHTASFVRPSPDEVNRRTRGL